MNYPPKKKKKNAPFVKAIGDHQNHDDWNMEWFPLPHMTNHQGN
jgi:hypothetical protein